MKIFKSNNTNLYNRNSDNDRWSNIPIISFVIIVLVILIYIGYFLEPDRNAENSFPNIISPNLNEIRNGSYWGLFTSSLLEPNPIFLVWGIGWLVYFGRKIENFIPSYSHILLILSSLIVPELVQILFFQNTGYGLGGVVTTCCGLLWFRSEFSQSEWYFSSFEKLHLTLFIFICILATATGTYVIGVPALIGGFIWGVFLGFITTFRSIIIRALIPSLIFVILLVPVFWAPWQTSWLVYQAEKHEKLSEVDKAEELYRDALAKDKNYSPAEDGLIGILHKEFKQYYERDELDKAKDSLLQILEIDSSNETAKKNLQITDIRKIGEEALAYHNQGVSKQGEKEFKEAEKLFKEAEKLYLEILKIEPDNEFAKENLQIIKDNLENISKIKK